MSEEELNLNGMDMSTAVGTSTQAEMLQKSNVVLHHLTDPENEPPALLPKRRRLNDDEILIHFNGLINEIKGLDVFDLIERNSKEVEKIVEDVKAANETFEAANEKIEAAIKTLDNANEAIKTLTESVNALKERQEKLLRFKFRFDEVMARELEELKD